MDASQVHDEESLRRYLNQMPKDEKIRLTLHVGRRAAERVLPVAIEYFARRPAKIAESDQMLQRVFGSVAFAGATLMPNMVGVPKIEKFGARTRAAMSAMSAFSAARMKLWFAGWEIEAAVDNALMAVEHSLEALDSGPSDLWPQISADLMRSGAEPLWTADVPPNLHASWTRASAALRSDTAVDWSFWIAWYERVLAGRDTLPDELAPIFNRLPQKTGKKAPRILIRCSIMC